MLPVIATHPIPLGIVMWFKLWFGAPMKNNAM
jgi:hypothetical protein